MKAAEFKKLSEVLSIFPYYTKQNLGLALGKEGFTLDYEIKKLIKAGILIPLKKGFYTSYFYLEKVKDKNLFEIYLQQLANVLREPSYISLETALSYYGLIPEESFAITSITLKSTRIYKNKLATFIYRNIKKELFLGFKEFSSDVKVKRASKSKALFDYLYLRRFKTKKQIEEFLKNNLRLNWFVLKKEDIEEFWEYVKLSNSEKMAFIGKVINYLYKQNG